MKKKYKVLILITLVLCVIGVLLWLAVPKPIIKENAKVEISKVTYKEKEVTSEVDLEAIEKIVQKYSASRVPRAVEGQRSQVVLEINSDVDGKPLHILLGKINVFYSSADKGGYTIHNSEELLAELEALMPT